MSAAVLEILGTALQKHLANDPVSSIKEVSVTADRITIVAQDQDGVRHACEVRLVPVTAQQPSAASADAGGEKGRCSGCCSGKEACGSDSIASTTGATAD